MSNLITSLHSNQSTSISPKNTFNSLTNLNPPHEAVLSISIVTNKPVTATYKKV